MKIFSEYGGRAERFAFSGRTVAKPVPIAEVMAISKVLITKCIIYFTWGDDTAVPYGITARNGMEATKAGGQKRRRIGYQQKMEMGEEICVITSSKAMFGKN